MSHIPHVKEVMDTAVVTIKPDMNVYDAIKILLDKGITSVSVANDDGRLVGILSEKDCLHTLVHGIYEGLPGKKVSEYMTKDVLTINPETDILTVANIFLRNTFRRLLVLDDGKIAGQITRRDMLRAIQKVKAQKVFNPITGKHEPVDPKCIVAAKSTES